MKVPFHGIIPAVHTPMFTDGSVNFGAINDYVDILEKESINDIFVLGTAGEGCSLSTAERKAVAEQWIKLAKNRIKNIVVHVGACNLADTKALAEHAESIGATAIACLPSFFFKPATPKILAMYLAEVARAAPNTPLMFYHIPKLTGVTFRMEHVFEEVERIGISTFAGVKFTALDMCDYGRCVERYGERYSVCYGFDEQCFAGLLLGGQSTVGSTYNFALRLYKRLFDACKTQDVERMKIEQFRSQKMISYLASEGLDVGMSKALMLPICGIYFGPPRLPVLQPTSEKLDRVIQNLRDMGFFEWIK